MGKKLSFKKGDKYGRLTISSFKKDFVGKKGRKIIKVFCNCDCGGNTTTTISQLRSSHTTSCGCYHKEKISSHNKSNSREYNSWAQMKQRCLNNKNNRYDNYGGRGIGFCNRWNVFENFLEDMGKRGENKTLDRIDNSKGYYKENCKWSSIQEQQNNIRSNILLELEGIKKTVAQWSREKGMKHSTLLCRVKRGWDIKKAITTEVRKCVKLSV